VDRRCPSVGFLGEGGVVVDMALMGELLRTVTLI